MRIIIMDLGVGNLFSLKCSLEREGAKASTASRLPDKGSFDALILPGVGDFTAAMKRMAGEKEKMMELARKGMPILGICLGMELFFERSEEGEGRGLGLLPGEVVRLPPHVKVPQMGWNTLRIAKPSPLLDGVKDGSWFYFVHSYCPRTKGAFIIAETDYGTTFPSAVAKGNILGTQFHPEKSGKVGLRILRNFLRFCKA